MAVPDTIFGVNSDSVQKILESCADEPKLQARVFIALHYFADKLSKSPTRVSTSSDTSPVYDPSTNSPSKNRPVRSKIDRFVTGKRTPEVDKAGADEDQIWRARRAELKALWQARRAELKALREEAQRLAQELYVEYIATSRWKFHQLQEYIQELKWMGAFKAAIKVVASAAAEKAAEAAEKKAAAERVAAEKAEAAKEAAAEKAAEKAETARKIAAERTAAKEAAAKEAAAAKKAAAERAAVEKAAAEKTAAAERAAAERAAAKEAAAKRAAAEKAAAEAAGKAAAEPAEMEAPEAAEEAKKKGKRKGKGACDQPRGPNGRFVAASQIPTSVPEEAAEAAGPAEGDEYARMEPLSQADKDWLARGKGCLSAGAEGVLKTKRQIQYYFHNPDAYMESRMVSLPEELGPEGHSLRKERGLPLQEIASWNRMALLSPERILRIAEVDEHLTVNYGQGEAYGKLDAITLRLSNVDARGKQYCSCGLPVNYCEFPGDMPPPGPLEKLESYEGQHAAYTLHGHYVDSEEED